MKAVVFVLAFLVGLLITFKRFDPRDVGAAPAPRPHADAHDAKSYGPLTGFACHIPNVCVHARRRAP